MHSIGEIFFLSSLSSSNHSELTEGRITNVSFPNRFFRGFASAACVAETTHFRARSQAASISTDAIKRLGELEFLFLYLDRAKELKWVIFSDPMGPT